jgi:hypothetical protein
VPPGPALPVAAPRSGWYTRADRQGKGPGTAPPALDSGGGPGYADAPRQRRTAHASRAEHRLPPDPTPAALRLRRGQPAEGGGTGARRGHRRSRHGQPGQRRPTARRRQTHRGGAGPAHAPLLGLEGDCRPAPRPRRLLRPPLRRRARPGQRGLRHPRLEGRARQPCLCNHEPGRCDPRAKPLLPDPPVRVRHRRSRRPLDPACSWRGDAARARPRDDPLGAEADSADRELPLEPDGADHHARLLPRAGCLRAAARGLHHQRPRLCRDLFRRRATPLGARRAGREGGDGRVHLDVQDLFDGRLADRLRRRQPEADRGACAREVLSRLRRLRADPDRCRRRPERAAGLRRPAARALSRAARRAAQGPRRGRLDRSCARGLDVRLGADSGPFRPPRLARLRQASAREGPGGGQPGRRLRRARRRPRPDRAGREHAPYTPGLPVDPRLPAGHECPRDCRGDRPQGVEDAA